MCSRGLVKTIYNIGNQISKRCTSCSNLRDCRYEIPQSDLVRVLQLTSFSPYCQSVRSANSISTGNESNTGISALHNNQRQPVPQVKTYVLDLDEVVQLIAEEGGTDTVVIKVPETMCYVDYFIISTANSHRHLFSIVEILNKLYKSKRKPHHPFTVIEGQRQSDIWQCLDIGNMVIHIMTEETREYYNLEKLWLLGSKYDDNLHEVPSSDQVLEMMSMQGLSLMSMNEDTVKALGNFQSHSPWSLDLNGLKDDDKNAAIGIKDEGSQDESSEDEDAFLV